MGGYVVCITILCFLAANIETEVEATSQSPPTDQPYRTAYHFQPPKNWMNDPNGPMYYNGVYHIFYQHNPVGPLFGDSMVWAHSVSYDLINWIHLEPALYPSEPFDIHSCYSGSATILPGNKPVIMYTGIDSKKHQVQNLAVPKSLSDPFLREWVKYSGNPIITPPDDCDPKEFRDPSSAWLGPDGKWRIIVGGVRNNKEGIAFVYQSGDFFNWTKVDNPLFALEGSNIWECVDFYPVSVDSKNGLDTSVVNPSVKHVIKVSLWAKGYDCYVVGSYASEKENYIPEKGLTGSNLDLKYDYGKFFASKTFYDDGKNRRVLWGWVNESDSTEDVIQKGWFGLQAIPRSVWLDMSGKQLVQWPVEEIEALRENEVSVFSKKLESGSLFEVEGITATQADVKISFELKNLEDAEVMDPSWMNPQLLCSAKDASTSGKFGPFGLLALASSNLTEQTAIFFRIFKGHDKYIVLMCSDQSRSSLSNTVDKTTYGAFVDIDPRHEEISLRTLVDHSIIESFGGEGRSCITARVYPKLAIDKEARLFVFNNGTQSVVISKLNAWSMKNAQINSPTYFGNNIVEEATVPLPYSSYGINK